MRGKKVLFAVLITMSLMISGISVAASEEYDSWDSYNKNREAMYGSFEALGGPDYGQLFIIVGVAIALVIAFLALALALAKNKEAERLYLKQPHQ
ncbi:MAG: hypothetical protein WBC21_02605 [Minisyncoccales bacterium]